MIRKLACIAAAAGAVVVGPACASKRAVQAPPARSGESERPAAMEKEEAGPAQAPSEVFARLKVLGGTPWPGNTFRDFGVNPTIETAERRVSAFAVDACGASYAIARAYLDAGHLPEETAVRVEEFVNAFDYGYEAPRDSVLAMEAEAFPSPNRRGYHVLRIGLTGRRDPRRPASVAFVIAPQGYAAPLQEALHLLERELDGRDTMSILREGPERGIERAYESGATRIVLFSDGALNAAGMVPAIRAAADRGVTLSVVGFGLGRYDDAQLGALARAGDGQYVYLHRPEDARRVLAETVARDVTVEVDFDPEHVLRWRLLGYESRLAEEGQAAGGGEIAAGQSVTALYEIKLREAPAADARVAVLRVNGPGMERPILGEDFAGAYRETAASTRLAIVAAAFAEKLRGSYWVRNLSWGALAELHRDIPAPLGAGEDVRELGRLIARAGQLDRRADRFAGQGEMDFDRLPILERRP